MTVSGGVSRPTVLLANNAAIAVDQYLTYQVECAGFSWAVVRVVCDKNHGMFLQGIGQVGGEAGDLYEGITKLALTGVTGSSTGHAHVVNVAPLGVLQILVHNEDATNAGTATVEVTLGN